MKLEQGQHVKCFMRSTMVLEGLVEEWMEAQVVLKSLDGQSLMIIHSPVTDIIITKVVLQEISEEEVPKRKTPQEWLDNQPQELIKEKLAEVLIGSDNPDLDNLNIEQLRQLVREQEKQMIDQKKKEHFGTPNVPKRTIQYSSPFGDKKSGYDLGNRPRKK